MDLTFRDLSSADATALLAAYDTLSARRPATIEVTPEGIVSWLLEDPTANQVVFLRTLAEKAPDWVTATDLLQATGLSPSALGGANARIHARVDRRFGPGRYPWEREERGDVIRYRMSESVGQAVKAALGEQRH